MIQVEKRIKRLEGDPRKNKTARAMEGFARFINGEGAKPTFDEMLLLPVVMKLYGIPEDRELWNARERL